MQIFLNFFFSNVSKYRMLRCNLFPYLSIFFFPCPSLRHISLFLSQRLSVSLLVFHAYARAHSGIPHRRNNYYYESDPGQETTIVSTFLLLLPTYSSLADLSWTSHKIHGACFILASYRIILRRRTEHSMVYWSSLPCDNYSESG